jgi:hypothetical protein
MLKRPYVSSSEGQFIFFKNRNLSVLTENSNKKSQTNDKKYSMGMLQLQGDCL